MKILVAGGAGFVGSHLCDSLIEQGHEVICADNLVTGSARNIQQLRDHERFTYLRHDITEPLDIDCDAIFGMASPASPVDYREHSIGTLRVNSIGTMNLLELAARQGAKFLQASTSEVYGDPEVHPQPETYWGNVNPAGLRACYDEGKRFAEAATMEWMRAEDVDARIVRIFNTYGPRNAIDDGRVVPNFITQAIRGEPLTIYGDGSQTRSFCYVSDLVAGLQAAMFTDNTRGEIYNLGNPGEFTIKEFAELVTRIVGSASTVTYEPLRFSDDPTRRRPDITKAKRELGWEPRISLEEGLRQTIPSFRERLAQLSAVSP